MIDPRLRHDIQGSEGCKLASYRDTENVLTIGWGHELPDQTQQAGNLVWTQQQADDQLDQDIGLAQQFAGALAEWTYLDTDCRRNAVVELCFELRRRWLPFVKTREAIKAHDWQGAHDGLLASLWAKQVHAARANRLAGYLLNGQYPA